MPDKQIESTPEDQPIRLETDEAEAYVPQEPTKKEVTAAKTVMDELNKRVKDYGDDQTVSALIALVDVIDPFRTPETWLAGEGDEYAPAPAVTNIAKYLLLGCGKLELDPKNLLCLFRSKDKWMDGERPMRGDNKKFDGVTQYLLDGTSVLLRINFHHWLTMNPLQKVQTIYHVLRQVDAEGKAVRPHFAGYFDELEIFGLRSFHEFVELGRSLAVAEGVEHPHQLLLFTEDEGHEA